MGIFSEVGGPRHVQPRSSRFPFGFCARKLSCRSTPSKSLQECPFDLIDLDLCLHLLDSDLAYQSRPTDRTSSFSCRPIPAAGLPCTESSWTYRPLESQKVLLIALAMQFTEDEAVEVKNWVVKKLEDM